MCSVLLNAMHFVSFNCCIFSVYQMHTLTYFHTHTGTHTHTHTRTHLQANKQAVRQTDLSAYTLSHITV